MSREVEAVLPKFVPMSVEYLDHMGSDVNVVNSARVSYAKEVESFDKDKDAKLINYLAKYDHWSPFAHTSVSLRIKAPIFVARQLVKHCVGGNWNEESRRYISNTPEFYKPDVWRNKPKNSKQGSEGEHPNSALWDGMIVQKTSAILEEYEWMIKEGVAPEQARMILPQNTMTNWIWTGSVAFFARVCKQRLALDAQKESQEVAQKIQEVVAPLFPYSWEALMKWGR